MYILSRYYKAILVYLVLYQLDPKKTYSVINAAFHKIVAKVAEKIVVPTHH
jgi:hypothetical protein